MANHPNRSRTYWRDNARGFANEYRICIATTHKWGLSYADAGYERIARDVALSDLVRKGDAATQMYASAEMDGEPMDRRDVAAMVRNANR